MAEPERENLSMWAKPLPEHQFSCRMVNVPEYQFLDLDQAATTWIALVVRHAARVSVDRPDLYQ